MRVLFLGNLDNLGYELCKWCRRQGIAGVVHALEHDLPRSQPELVDPAAAAGYPDWYRIDPGRLSRYMGLMPRRRLREWERDFDVAVVSGTRGLLASRGLRLPKVLYAIGGEVAQAPFMTAARWRGTAIQLYRIARAPLARQALQRVDLILDSYPPNLEVIRRFGLSDRHVLFGMGRDTSANREMAAAPLLAELEGRYGGFRRVFLWFSRLNFRKPDHPAYKGAERYLAALRSMRAELEEGNVRLVIGRHGDDADAFVKELGAAGIDHLVDWVDHLRYPELLAYLSLRNGALFAEFGERSTILGGLHRDALTMGTVLVSSADPEYARRMYGETPPVLRAVTHQEIVESMRRVIGMPDGELAAMQDAGRRYANEHLDYDAIVPRLLEVLRRVVADRRAVQS